MADNSILHRTYDAWRETGLLGVTRRAGRIAARSLADAASLLERELLQQEFDARTMPVRSRLQSNRQFKGKHAGQRAFILATGPSIREQDLSPLAGEVTFAVNGFWRHPVLEQWQPDYFFFQDWRLFDAEGATFFHELAARTPHSQYFVPADLADAVAPILAQERTHVLALNGILHESPLRQVDLERVLPTGGTVALLATMGAIYMGCDPIILLGIDSNWLDDFGHDDHFYPEKTLPHVNLSDTFRVDYKETVDYVSNVLAAYDVVAEMARHNGVQLLNATPRSRVERLPRVNYASLFER